MASDGQILSPVRDEHFRAFGAIIHMFARHEFLMVGIISSLTKAHIAHAAMLMAELSYRGKRDAVLALIQIHLDEKTVEAVRGYLGQLHSWNPLRNAIAHSTWKEGRRDGSIKPFSMSVRGGTMKPIGIEENERDYTGNELTDIAEQLMRLHTRFREYLDKECLVETGAKS